jgi:hypothetical protein
MHNHYAINSSTEWNTCNRKDFISLLKDLSLSNFFVSGSILLCSLIPEFTTLFLKRFVLNNRTCRSNSLHVLYLQTCTLCLTESLYFLVQPTPSGSYKGATVSKLLSFNTCLQDVYQLLPLIIQITPFLFNYIITFIIPNRKTYTTPQMFKKT